MLVFVIIIENSSLVKKLQGGYLQMSAGSKGYKREGLESVVIFDHTLKFTAC